MPPHDGVHTAATDEGPTIQSMQMHHHQHHKGEHNSAPISKLPSELIINIINRIVVDITTSAAGKADDHLYHPYHSYRPPLDASFIYSWIPVTQFCARWRSVALECPELWAHIWAINLSWFTAFLERSKDQPLHFDTWRGRSGDDAYDSMIRLIAENMHRVYSLSIRLECVKERTLWLRSVPAPQLEVLRLSDDDEEIVSEFGSDFDSEPPSPPDVVELAVMPKLRQLQVDTCWIDQWSYLLPSHLPTVTEVIVADIMLSNQLNLLRRCPAVRRLSVRYDWETGEGPLSTSVHLPELQYLRVSHVPSLLLDHLLLPSLSTIDIQGDMSNKAEPSPVLLRALQFFQDHRRPSLHPHHFSLSIGWDELSLISQNADNDDLVLFNVSGGNRSNSRQEEDILYLVRLAEYNIRSLSTRGILSCYFISRCYSPLRDLNSLLEIHVEYTQGLASILSFGDHKREFQKVARHLPGVPYSFCCCESCHDMRVTSFPGLETLVLDKIKEGELLGTDTQLLGALLEWLKGRAERGLKLHTLALRFVGRESRDGFRLKGLEMLKEFVTNLDVEHSE
ncbi:hypothetical protein AX16_001104 [Volvariella volvacea WC 439]|nr:hypothetical protein AX16_001104 [Volvariella volvacea WC 439]